jgi:CHAT domain-containing protein
VQARLAPDNAILMLDQAPGELLSWKITARDVDVQRTPCTESQTRQLIARHRRAIAGGQRRDPASATLFDCVLAPWSSSLDATAVVAVVPDGAWHRVAWPALWDRSTGRELIHRMFTVVAPSASIAASGAARPGASVESAALVVSVAAGGSSRAPLPAARAEARAVAALYPGSRLIEGADATPAHVAREALHARVIHVSSHASDVPAYPLLSHLVLSGEPPNGDALYARDVARLDLARTDLVVLAACGTAGERAVRGEGSVGMAWSFLVAGAARVIATLDDVEDRAASEVFVDIHRRLAAGIPAVESVGRVQRELAAAGAPPRVWATVTVVGAL